ncbi:MAG TPA: DUF5318 family protein [Mycobacteriales bacterium]|nr:DUF5318 family protein [Mycobacteriales bacterium]
MRTQRSAIDYALAKRAALADLFAGRTSAAEVCDAHPYLLRAAKYHGEPTDKTCPVCKGADPLTHVTYVYGDDLKQSSGQARSAADLSALAAAHDDLAVYVVEVCRRCGWNHLDTSYLLSRAGPPSARRTKRRTASQSADS